MFKAWVCIIMMAGGYSSAGGPSGVATSVIGDIARKEDCQRIGKAAIAAADRVEGRKATYQCVEMMHTPE